MYLGVRSLFPLVDGDAPIGAYEPTAGTADTVVVRSSVVRSGSLCCSHPWDGAQ